MRERHIIQTSSGFLVLFLCAFNHVSATIDDIVPATALVGCFVEDQFDREFTVVAGDYRRRDLTPQLCRYRCHQDGFKYAALQAGQFCFCGDTYGRHGPSAGCNTPCLGDPGSLCGGSGNNYIYTTPDVVDGLDIAHLGDVFTLEDTTIIVNKTGGAGMTYEYFLHDGAQSSVKTTNGVLVHSFRSAGKTEVVLIGTDGENNAGVESEVTMVYTRVRGVELSCPAYIAINTQFECTLVVSRGTELSAFFNFDDGSDALIYPADTLEATVGKSAGTPSANVNRLWRLYLMTNQVFEKNGTIMALEFQGKAAGSVFFQVWRPSCGTGMTFCYLSYTCIVNTTSCSSQTNYWRRTCPSGSMFSLSRRECVSKSTKQSVDTFPYMGTGTFASLRVDSYDFVDEVSLTAVVGDNFVGLADSNAIRVLAGDVLAVYQDGTGQVEIEDGPPGNYELCLTVPAGFSTRATSGSTIKAGVTGDYTTYNNFHHLVKAHYIQDTCLKFQHNYTDRPGVHNMTANVTNKLSDNLFGYALVDVQGPITDMRFNCHPSGLTNKTFELTIPVHPGSNVTYTWNFGDGEQNVTASRDTSHTFKGSGVYQIKLYGANEISDAYFSFTVIIQDEILGIQCSTRQVATIFTEHSYIDWNVTQGTNITYFIGIDNVNYTFTHDDYTANLTDNGLSGWLAHLMSGIGNYSVVITASNLLTSQSCALWLPVQIPATNFSIIQPPVLTYGQIPSVNFKMDAGSHLKFTSYLGGHDTHNLSYDGNTYSGFVLVDTVKLGIGPHILNITIDNLVAPPWTEHASFYIDYAITDGNVTQEHMCLPPQVTNTFNITMKWASRYFLFEDYGDGTSNNEYHALTLSGDVVHVNHSWAMEGNYTVNITLVNELNSITFVRLITVQNRVQNLELNHPFPVKILPNYPGETNFSIRFLGGLIPTSAFYVYSFGEGPASKLTRYLGISSSTTIDDKHNYTTTGTYNLTLNASNCVSYQWFQRDIVVDEPIMGLTVWAEPRNHKLTDTVTIHVKTSWGSRLNLTWIFQDGTNDTRYFDTHEEDKSITHVYPQIGHYPVHIVATNIHGTHNATLMPPVIVQQPTRNLTLNCEKRGLIGPPYWNVSLPCQIWLTKGTPFPTDANITINFGDNFIVDWPFVNLTDGTDTISHDLVYRFEHPRGYLAPGEKNVSVTIYNLASEIILEQQVDLYTEIIGLNRYILTFDNKTGTNGTGLGNGGIFYPLEDATLFYVDKYKGSHVYYNWDFGNGYQITVYEQSHFIYQYSQPGTYNVILNASNVLDMKILKQEIQIQRSCARVAISVESPAARNTTFQFHLDPGSIPTDACYFINFVDENSTTNKYWFMGDEAQCKESHPDEWDDTFLQPRRFLRKTAKQLEDQVDNPNITIDHVFMTVNSYYVTLNVSNQVSNCSYQWRTGVTKGPCYWPTINLKQPNRCLNENPSNCRNGKKVVLRSQALLVHSKVKINCTSTKSANYYWKIFKVNSDGTETNYTDLPDDIKLGSKGLITLKLPPRSLMDGLYKFVLNVSMLDEQGIDGTGEVYIYVDVSPLEARIKGGDQIRIKWGNDYIMNALDYSFDPDTETTDKEGMEFTWYCRRSCETWPEMYPNFTIIDHRNYNPCPDSEYRGTFLFDKGCFTEDGFNGPGPIPLPGDNYTGVYSGLFPFDTTKFPEAGSNGTDMEVEIMVVMRKGSRVAAANQRIRLSLGDPPLVDIRCVSNCLSKINTGGRLSLESQILGWRRWIEYSYRWSLQRLVPGQKKEDAGSFWHSKASTGLSSDNMAIDEGAFVGADTNFLYFINVISWRTLGDENNYGLSSRLLLINAPPVPGTCHVEPAEGVSLETEFKVVCSKEFKDEDGMEYYTMAYRISKSEDWNWIYRDTEPRMETGTVLPNGLESNNYNLEIMVRGFDKNSGSSDAFTTVKVNPPDLGSLQELLANMSSPGGLLEALGRNANPAQASRTCGTVANVLNSQVLPKVEEVIQEAPTYDGLSDEEMAKKKAEHAKAVLQAKKEARAKQEELLKERKQQREQLIKVMTNIEQVTVDGIKQVGSALATLTQNPKELTAAAADVAAEACGKGIDMLAETVALGSSTADDVEAASRPVLSVIGNLMMVVGLNGEEEDVGSDCDIEGLSDDDKALCLKERRQQQEKDRIPTDQVENSAEKLENQVSSLSKTVLKMKVAGERQTAIVTPSMQLNLYKTFTREISQAEVKGGKGNKIRIPSAKELFGNDNDTTYFVQSTCVRYEKNPYTYGNQTDGKVLSQVVSLDFRNDTGGTVPVSNLKEDFVIQIDRPASAVPVTRVSNWTSPAKDRKTTTVHVIPVQPQSGLHLRLAPWLNQSEIDPNDTSELNITYDTDYSSYGYQWKVYILVGRRPDLKKLESDYDFNCTIPLSFEERVAIMERYSWAKESLKALMNATGAPKPSTTNYVPVTTTSMPTTSVICMPMSDNNTTLGNTSSTNGTLTNCSLVENYVGSGNTPGVEEDDTDDTPSLPDRNTCFLSPEMLSLNTTTDIYVIIKHIETEKASTKDDSDSSQPSEEFQPARYDLAYYVTQCLYWDTDENIWNTEGCKMSPLTRVTMQHCLCNHLTSFGGGFSVPMNRIDMKNSAFTKLDENPIVFATMVCLMCMYAVLCIWARRADKLDAVKAGVLPLVDNKPGDDYLYEITIYTGARTNAGTTSKIKLMMSGDQADSGPRLMLDDKRDAFQRSQTDSFLMACPKKLGALQHIRIWHDNSGSSPGWYFSRMLVTDLQTERQYFFICDRWLALEEDDGMIDRLVPVAGLQELTDFNHLFWKKTQQNLTDGHIWFSVFQRPAKSRFTRVQRLTCCLALLFSSMMANILFYNQSDVQGANPQVYRLGPIQFTLSQIYVGIISSLIVLPANLVLVSIFRYAKPRSQRNLATRQSVRTAEIYKPEYQEEEYRSELEGQKNIMDSDSGYRLGSAPSPCPISAPVRSRSTPLSARGVGLRMDPSLLEQDTNSNNNSNNVPVVSQTTKEKDTGLKKKDWGLPWWSIYFGYFLSLSIVGVAFWMTVEVAGVFGAEKSAQWLFSFCTSILESIFLSQPIKVLVLALFYALIIRKPDVEDEERPSQLKPDEELLRVDTDNLNPEIQKALSEADKMPLKYDEEYLRACREERLQEVKMWQIIREVILYVLFLYFLMMVAYGNRDPWSHIMYHNFKSSLVWGAYDKNHTYRKYGMEKVRSREQFWNWAENVMVPSLYGNSFYDGHQYSWLNGYTGDVQSNLIGSPRFRMTRVKPVLCPTFIRDHVSECRYGYNLVREDERSYHVGWKLLNSSDPFDASDENWAYKSWNELNGFPFSGLMATYGGGGYVVDLSRDKATAISKLKHLKDNDWLDKYTRGVFIQFLAYNPNINLFGVSQTVFEFTETGACWPYFRFHVMRLDRYVGAFMFVVLAAEVFTLLFIIFFLFREIVKVVKMKLEYFKDGWNILEFVTVGFGVGAVVLFFYRLFVGNKISKEMHEKPTIFHNFQYVVFWDQCFGILLGIIVTLANVKFTRLLRFNKRMSMLASTLSYASKNLFQFLFMFIILFSAFTQVAYLMFFYAMEDFSTFIRSAETLFSSMLNKFDFNTMQHESRLWGPIIIFLFTLFVTFILINFFITIINDAFEKVKHDVTKQNNDYEIVDFIMGRFKKSIGWGEEKQERKRGITNRHLMMDYNSSNYVCGGDENAEKAEALRSRVETMMSKLEILVNCKNVDKEVVNQLEAIEGRKKRKIVVSQ